MLHDPITEIHPSPLADRQNTREKLPPPGDRRRGDRRGAGFHMFRFTNDRRVHDDRRQRSRRGFDRREVGLPVELRHGGQSIHFETADISVLGASLTGAPELPVGSLVRLTFELPDDLAEFPIVTWAQAVSYDRDRRVAGMKFVGLRACDARRIGRFLAGLAPASPSGAPYPF